MHPKKYSTQQAVGDRWKRQYIVIKKVKEGRSEMAVVKSQIGTLHSHIDVIKATQKEMNGKLDELYNYYPSLVIWDFLQTKRMLCRIEALLTLVGIDPQKLQT